MVMDAPQTLDLEINNSIFTFSTSNDHSLDLSDLKVRVETLQESVQSTQNSLCALCSRFDLVAQSMNDMMINNEVLVNCIQLVDKQNTLLGDIRYRAHCAGYLIRSHFLLSYEIVFSRSEMAQGQQQTMENTISQIEMFQIMDNTIAKLRLRPILKFSPAFPVIRSIFADKLFLTRRFQTD